MTCKRIYGEGTAFSEWLRNVEVLDSFLGYRNTNLDYIWSKFADSAKSEILNYMLIEEKTRGGFLKANQTALYKRIALNCKDDPCFRGCYVLQFQKETPEDGKMLIADLLNGASLKQITLDQLVEFLRFNKTFQEICV
jgi:hypothetical protein